MRGRVLARKSDLRFSSVLPKMQECTKVLGESGRRAWFPASPIGCPPVGGAVAGAEDIAPTGGTAYIVVYKDEMLIQLHGLMSDFN